MKQIYPTLILTIFIVLLTLSCNPDMLEEDGSRDETEVVIIDTHRLNQIKVAYNSRNTIRLTWENSVHKKHFIIYCATSRNGTYVKVGESITNYYTHTGLKESTVYFYKISYINLKGQESEKSSIFSAVTCFKRINGFEMESFTYNYVELKWAPDNSSDGYRLYKKVGDNGTYNVVKTITSSQTGGYKDEDVAAGRTYYYKIIAYKTVDSIYESLSLESNEIRILLDMSIPQGVSITSMSSTNITISWFQVLDLNMYIVYRAPDLNGPYIPIGKSENLTYEDSGLQPGQQYFYKVSACSGNKEFPLSEAKKAITIPSAPQNVKVDSWTITNKNFIVTWSEIHNNNMISGYRIFCSPKPIKDITKQSASDVIIQHEYNKNSTSCIIKNLEKDKDYYVYVQSFIDDNTTTGDRLYSLLETDKTTTPEKIKGEVQTRTKLDPVHFSKSTGDANSITLSWNFKLPVETYEYHIYRTEQANTAFTEETKVAVIKNSKAYDPNDPALELPESHHQVKQTLFGLLYTNSELILGATYYYKMRIKRLATSEVKPENISILSNKKSQNTQLLPVTGLQDVVSEKTYTSLKLQWDKLKGVPKYKIFKKLHGKLDANYELAGEVDIINVDVIPDETVDFVCDLVNDINFDVNKAYDYKVQAFNAAGTGEGGPPDTLTCITTKKPPAPATVTSTTDATNTINLSWTAPVLDTGYSAVYKVERVIDQSNCTTLVENYDATSFQDTGPNGGFVANQKYLYRISTSAVKGSIKVEGNGVEAAAYTVPEPPEINDATVDMHNISLTINAAKFDKTYNEIVVTYSTSPDFSSGNTDVTYDHLNPKLENLNGGTQYWIKVQVKNTKTKVLSGESLRVDRTTDLNVPAEFKGGATTANKIALTWSPVNGAVKYVLARGEEGMADEFYTTFNIENGTTHVDEFSFIPNRLYIYKIKAVSSLGIESEVKIIEVRAKAQ